MADSEALAAELTLQRIMAFAGARLDDENMRAVYYTIARHNLGSTYRPGGSADAYLIGPDGRLESGPQS